ncbi:hypothetical protein [Conexibacter sp. SYSU D00693]|uniref:hypothetical protein n=1 Tax=Conexibacter sp. SYSU D00693 TaxID=2812560 RepID=UPI00196A40EA|nr:hypothetical protein [Conexibacter sp. SYSU D00693]
MTLSHPALTFTRHYVEMVLVMVAGMLVLGAGMAGVAELAGPGMDALRDDAPALVLAGMCVSMCVPMTAYMRWRGHGWTPTTEMNASMVVPTLAAIALQATGTLETTHDALMVQHVAMLPAMLAVMLARRGEYAGHAHH